MMLSWLGNSLTNSLSNSTLPLSPPTAPPSTSPAPITQSRPPFTSPPSQTTSDPGPTDTCLSHSRPGSSIEDEDDHETKRRKGLTGAAISTLSGALDAAIFTSALGYSAWQLWKHPPSHEDVDLALARSKSGAGPGGSGTGTGQAELPPPPPYSAIVSRL